MFRYFCLLSIFAGCPTQVLQSSIHIVYHHQRHQHRLWIMQRVHARECCVVCCCLCALHYTLDGIASTTKKRQPAPANTKAHAINVGLSATITHLHSPTWHNLRTQPAAATATTIISSACFWHTPAMRAEHTTCAHHIQRAVRTGVWKSSDWRLYTLHTKHTEHVVIFHYTSAICFCERCS